MYYRVLSLCIVLNHLRKVIIYTWKKLTLSGALSEIKSCVKSSSKRCSISYVSFDSRRKTSGPKQVHGAFYAKGSHDEMKHGTIHVATDDEHKPYPIHLSMIMSVNKTRVYV